MTDDHGTGPDAGSGSGSGGGEPAAPAGMPPKGEASTAWEDQGSLVERLRSPGHGRRGSPEAASGAASEAPSGAPTGAASRGPAQAGQPSLAGQETSAEERAGDLRRRMRGPAGRNARTELDRALISRRADEMRGLTEIEDAQRIVLHEPAQAQLTDQGERSAARKVAGWFLLSAAATVGFCLLYALTSTRRNLAMQNQLLGLTLGVALLAIGIGAIVWVNQILPHEQAVQMREPLHPTPEERQAVELDWAKGVEETGVTRRKVLLGSLGISMGVLPLAPLFLLRDLGPSPTGGAGRSVFTYTAWRKGMRFVEYDTRLPVKLGDIEVGSLLTIVPEGHQDAAADSAVMLIRLRPDSVNVASFDGYAAKFPKDGYRGSDFVNAGHVAYSKVCTHAGCPVSLYEQQLEQFLCPCHQSTFEAYRAGRVIFGPAARALPMLPFYVDSEGFFRAKGDFPEPVGPSFWERG
ncbi:MAG: Rieske 2Fe-2S domain-containing protein [Frankiaceae bacterium]